MTTIHTRQLQQYTQDKYNNTHKTTTTIHTRQLQQYTQDNYNNTIFPDVWISPILKWFIAHFLCYFVTVIFSCILVTRLQYLPYFFLSTFTSTKLISLLAIITGSDIPHVMYVFTHLHHTPAAEVCHSLPFKILLACWTFLLICTVHTFSWPDSP